MMALNVLLRAGDAAGCWRRSARLFVPGMQATSQAGSRLMRSPVTATTTARPRSPTHSRPL